MRRQAVRAGAIAGLVLLVTACSTGVAPATPETGAPSPAPSAPSAAALPSPAVRQITLTVAGRSVTGDTGLVALRVGDPAQVTVTSDVADEVHVHGSGGGVGGQVPAGGSVTIAFTETAPGRYEIELERAKRTLTRLQVREG